MKNKSESRIVKLFNNIINIRAWADFDRVKTFTLYLVNSFKKFFIPQKRGKSESFEEAMLRLNISETDLQAKKKALYRLSLLMCAAAIFILTYAIYHIVYGNIRAVLVSLVLMLIALVLAFRYHFWYFQIKERKLGCTFREWYKQGLMGEK
ncbi:type IVB secretion system protein IcmV [Legionella fairfieldensis]|uniref:type IVB secretion system protein IcmV n=1 Tax=Legionella fairfieldensis TaxID=45064 RepID=UPI00048D90A1|nr:type IVB secretion system protein IcmV [Legionella fairfieldensis]